MRKSGKNLAAVLAIAALVAAGCGSSKSSSPPTSVSPSTSGGSTATTAAQATGTPIKIGMIYSATGGASSSYINSEWGAEARIDAQNAAGGVNGHPLQLQILDDQSSVSGNAGAAQLLVSKGAFGVIEDSSFTIGGYKFLASKGVPVTGAAIDGPEWNTPGFENMFSVIPADQGAIQGKYYTYDSTANLFKSLGVTKLGGVAYAIESAIQSLSDVFQTATPLGISQCYVNNTIPFGAADFTAVVLALKAKGCDGVYGTALLASVISLSTAIKQAGMNAKQAYPTSYDQSLLNNAQALADMTGTYALSMYNTTTPNSATKEMLANLSKYTPFKSGIPSLNIVFGYTGADLMIKGLQMAGPNPTRQAFITNLRTVSSYDAEGIFPSSVSFQNFGTPQNLPQTSCGYVFTITSSGYQTYNNGKPLCGKLVQVKVASA
jgi:branched-chain amino acid transport system substrate-binding protein